MAPYSHPFGYEKFFTMLSTIQNRLSIKQGLWLLAAGIAAALMAIWLLDQHYQRRITEETALQSMNTAMSRQLQTLRQQMDAFASSRQLTHAEQFRASLQQLKAQHRALVLALRNADLDETGMLAAGDLFQQVESNFNALVHKQVTIGIARNEGHAGQLNAAAQRVEEVVTALPTLAVSFLQLRQHEKNFLLYRDETYINQFMVALSQFRGTIFMSDLDNQILAATQQSLRAYTDSFNTMAQLQRDIGLSSESGLTGELNRAASKAEQQTLALAQQLDSHLDNRLDQARLHSTLSVLVIMALVLTTLALFIRQLNRHFAAARSSAQRLGDGDLQTPIEQIPGNEIGELLKVLETMRSSLLDKSDALARDNHSKSFLSDLGHTLQGVKDTTTLCDDIIRYLCSRLKAHVGALYVAEGDGLVRRATYGIASLEMLAQVIEPGEGIVGQCASDRKPRHLHNLPHDYLLVTTGSTRQTPSSLLLMPLLWNNQLYGVLELGAVGSLPDFAGDFLHQASEPLAIALHTSLVNAELTDLLAQQRTGIAPHLLSSDKKQKSAAEMCFRYEMPEETM
ncbi:MAG: hypothetical protein CL537_04525 [Alcanivoracaceae bacterium]|nr:hypothetical protein [Alcanivoracaceae bacterium]